MDSDRFSSTLDLPNYFAREYAALRDVGSPKITLHLPIGGEQISNSKAIVNALKLLQERIHHLEHDRSEAVHRPKLPSVKNLRKPNQNRNRDGQSMTKKRASKISNYQEIPFIVGMSTTPSHSVIANYQQVLATMKLQPSKSILYKSALISKYESKLDPKDSPIARKVKEIQRKLTKSDLNWL